MRIRYLIIVIATAAFVSAAPVWALKKSGIETAGTEFELVSIGPGTFTMGSNSVGGDERPAHKVTIDYSFDIGKTEVTVGQFRAFIKDTGYKTEVERHHGAWLCPCPDKTGGSFGAPPWLCRSYIRMWTLLSAMVNQKKVSE